MQDRNNETKERIISLAYALFRNHGYEKVTISDICSDARISKHTFYYYFRSKEDLLLRFFHVPMELSPEQMAAIMGLESPLEQVWRIIEPRIDHFTKIGPEILKRVLIINMQNCNNTIHPQHDKTPFHELEIELLRKAQDIGEVQNLSSPKQLLHLSNIQMAGLMHFWVMTDGSFDLNSSVRHAFEIILFVREDCRRCPGEKILEKLK